MYQPNLQLNYPVLQLKEVDSTNTFLKQGSFANRTVVIADRQTAGKGRLGKSWAGAPAEQALYLSVLFHSMPVSHIGFLPLVCALAAAKSLGETVQIKWPNDLVLGGKKICGILCESMLISSFASVVCGFGLNLSQPDAFFTSSGLVHAGSFCALSGKTLDRQTAANRLLDALFPMVDTFLAQGAKAFLEPFSARCLTLKNEVQVLQNGSAVRALAVGVGLDGSLLCENENGVFSVHAGEASVRGLYGYV